MTTTEAQALQDLIDAQQATIATLQNQITNLQSNQSAILGTVVPGGSVRNLIDANAAGVEVPADGQEVDTGQTWLGRTLYRTTITQQTAGGVSQTAPGANGTAILTGVWEVRWWVVMLHLTGSGANFWTNSPYVAPSGEAIGAHMQADGTVYIGDWDPQLTVQNWRAVIEYTKR